MKRAALALLLGAACLGASCQGAGSPPAPREDPFAIRTLDDAGAAGLRREFDQASDRARYVVTLSPT